MSRRAVDTPDRGYRSNRLRVEDRVVPAPRARIAVVNDYEIVVAGLAALLEQFPDQLDVVEQLIVGEPLTEAVDVALYDTYGRVGIATPTLRALHDTPGVRHVAVFSLDLGPDLIAEGRSAGVD